MKIFKSKKIFLFFSAVILIFLAVFLVKQKNKSSSLKIDPKKAITATVKKGDIQKSLIFSGKIDAQNFAVLRFQSSGRLAWLGVKEGDRVEKWQTLASLDKESLKKSLEKEMNDYLTSRWNFEDTQDSYKETKNNYLITPEIQRILDRQQFTLNNSVLDYEISNLTLKYANLLSPIEGIVTGIDYPSSGINIMPTNFAITVIDPNSLYFKSDVDEEDVIKLTIGQEAKIVLDSYFETTLNSKINDISFTPVEGESATVYKIKFDFPLKNENLKYRIGMNGDATVVLEEKKSVLLIPVEGYFEENEKKFVYLLDDQGKITEQEIKTGLESEEEIEITEGLSENQKIIY